MTQACEGELEAIRSWLLGKVDELRATDEQVLELMCADESVIETNIYAEVNGASDVTLKLN